MSDRYGPPVADEKRFAGLTARRRARGLPVGHVDPIARVEKTNPYSAHPETTDDRRTAGDRHQLVDHIEDLTGFGRGGAEEMADEALREGRSTWTDPETGHEVEAVAL